MAEFFDFIVVGGGQAGLTLAARLSEKPTITVLVLEAGGTGLDNAGISTPGLMGSTLGTEVDWKYSTTPQEGANQREIYYPRGKVLGGSSAINFLVSTRAEAGDYDEIEKLGNPGWGSADIVTASKKSEKLSVPASESGYIFDPEYHGRSGPVTTSFPTYIPPHFKSYFSAAAAGGHSIQAHDPFGGKLEGACIFPSTIDSKGARVTSATAYYFPNQSRANLIVRTYCEVNKLILTGDSRSGINVLGVEYASSGNTNRVMARNEVLMCAGSIGTPAILERSGIGNESILKPLNIPVALSLEGVGSNLSDHSFVLSTHPLKLGIKSIDDLARDPEFATEQRSLYEEKGTGILSHAVSVLDFCSLEAVVGQKGLQEALRLLEKCPDYMHPKQFEAVVDRIKNGVVLEFFLLNSFLGPNFPKDKDLSYVTAGVILQHPLSRGSSHISSQDPSKSPSINPGYLRHPFDTWLMVQGAKRLRKIMSQKAFKDAVEDEIYPGPSVATDEERENSIRNNVLSSYHPLGTCSMIPKSQMGVVDPQLRVYGTRNLRIVDASVVPIQLSAHPAMTVYAIAEKAAEMISNASTA